MMRRFRGLFWGNSWSRRMYLGIGWFVMDPVIGGSGWGPIVWRLQGMV